MHTHRWRTSLIGALALVSALSAVVAVAPPAGASGSATITGRATDRATGTPLAGICVTAYGNGQGGGTTAADGTYAMTVTLGSAGPVPWIFVRFTDCLHQRYAPQWYDDSPTQDGATQLTLAEGETRAGVDATLDVGGSITGRVTGMGNPLADICVSLYGPSWSANARTNGAGEWRASGLGAGTYLVQFQDCLGRGWLGEWYDDKRSMQEATPVSVALGADTGGINADLTMGSASISGTVTDDTGTPLGDVCVAAFSASSTFSARTAADGTYRTPVTPGPYKVSFTDCGAPEQRYVQQWWDHQPSYLSATTVTVATGQPVFGVDAALDRLGSMSGTVHDVSGAPIPDECVTAVRVGSTHDWRTTETGTDGRWNLQRVEPGDWTVLFNSCWRGNYAPRWYPDATREADATPVHLSPGGSLGDLDAVLPTGGSISGHLTADSGAPAADACVEARIPGDVFSTRGARSGPDGSYRIDGLGSGDYTLGFTCPPYVSEWYKDAASPTDATPVTVVEGAVTSSVDATLTRMATLGGHVRDAAGHGLSVCVRAVATDGSGTYLSGSNSDGSWVVNTLRPASYHVGFFDCAHRYGVLDEWWNDKPDEASADAIVASSALPRTDIDAVLDPAATLRGAVETADGSPATGICVRAFGPAPSSSLSSAVSTASDGSWTMTGLRHGRYTVQYSGCGRTIVDEWQRDGTTRDDADPVDIAAGTTSVLETERVSSGESAAPFALMGLHSVTIGAGTSVASGDLATHERRRDGQPEIALGDGVTVADRVVGDTVQTGTGDAIGDLWANERTGAGPKILRGTNTAEVPLLRLPTHRRAEPGTTDVMIAAGVAEISSGHYRDLVVESGATLRLTGGRYDARRVVVKPGGQLLYRVASSLRVADTVSIGASGYVGPGPISGLGARDFRIDVDGVSVSIGDGAHVAATVDAPDATLTTGSNVDLVGGYLAKDVAIGTLNHIRWWSGFADDPT